MKTHIKQVALTACFFIFVGCVRAPELPSYEIIMGRVVKIADGDTLTILTEENEKVKIRLYGIDAPESKQAYGSKSKENLDKLCAGVIAKVVVMDTDRYRRKVGVVYCKNLDANLYQLTSGYAWAYKQYLGEPLKAKYIEAEGRTQEAKKGLWQGREPIPPWEWRKMK